MTENIFEVWVKPVGEEKRHFKDFTGVDSA